ncbi:MFS transporter [Bacillus paranthracis]
MRNNKNLWILMFGVLGAELGMWLGLIGNLEFLQKNVESSFNQSLILIIGIATGFIFGPWAGTLIDSLNKKFVLILSGVVRIFAVLFMLMAVNLNSVIWMLVSMFLIGIASSFYFPGVQSIIPLIAKEEKSLIEANAIQMNVMTFARIIGTALAGVLLLLISLKEIYTYSLIAYSILLISTFFFKI